MLASFGDAGIMESSMRAMAAGYRAQAGALLVVLIALAGCHKSAPPAAEARQVQTVAVTLTPDDQESSYTGDVRPRWESALGFRVPGKIVSRAVDVGARVVKGQLLARLDPEDQRLGAEAARQQLVAARSDFEQAKADPRATRISSRKASSAPLNTTSVNGRTTLPPRAWSNPLLSWSSTGIRPPIRSCTPIWTAW